MILERSALVEQDCLDTTLMRNSDHGSTLELRLLLFGFMRVEI